MYATAALRIAEELRPRYMLEPGADDPDLQAEREMFKRLFYFLGVTATKFQFLQDHGALYIMEPSWIHKMMGPPKPLPGEEGLAARAVYCFAFMIELGNNQVTEDFTDMQYLYAKLSDKLSIESCSRVETSLIRWYNDLPASYRVTPNIFQYVPPEELARADPYTLNLATCFYACWLILHAHFLPPLEPDGSDALAAESKAAKLSLRSLTICVKSANIVTAIAEHMSARWRCRFEPHNLLHACDVHLRLSRSKDIRLAAMGRRNLRRSIEIFKANIWGSSGKVPGKGAHVSRYYTSLAGSLETSLAKFGIPF
ncbi:hypothetical protein BC938DRAFT_472445 [Jimgerdemannia flammicorona]|uniref:Transcription factor domain-containing protein n=1 Tax=Jimgerdemannia flammicorona TaxID=994334 RepID=A0A433Q635_9FUNG|nr:hypothetical protein BC938DRAFT_472445 [Jimgerdemannia flammicorona]